MPLPQPAALAVAALGPCGFPSPLQERQERFVNDTHRVLVASHTAALRPFLEESQELPAFKHHAVVVVAEGAGQEMIQEPDHLTRDASGNIRLNDIGVFLRDQITRHFAERDKEVTVKYIDPSYIIRGIPANSIDSEYCLLLGQHAVHAGMAGRTDMVVGYWNQRFTHLPIAIAVTRRKQIDPDGEIWQRVLEATGQPASMIGKAC